MTEETNHGNPIAEQIAAQRAAEEARGPESNGTEESREGTEPEGQLTEEEEQSIEKADNPDAVRELIRRTRRDLASRDAELKRYRDQAKAADDAKKSEVQRLSDENTELKAELVKLRIASLRSDIAAKYELSPQWAQRLRGSTEEEIEADAKALAKELGAGEIPDLGQGARRSAPARGDGAFNDMIRSAAGRGRR